jgi:hypothetical protein
VSLLSFHKGVHEFIDWMVDHCECPSMWPLTQTEQVNFIRSAIFKARKIRNTEEYLAEAVRISTDAVVKIEAPLCKCGKPRHLYGGVGGYSAQCADCNEANAKRQRIGRAKRKANR